MNELIERAKKFLLIGKNESEIIDYGSALEPIARIGSILTTIGVAVILGATAYMGIKYLVSTPETRAKLKQQLIGLLVSGVVIFGAYFIWQIVLDVGSKLE